MSTTTLPVLEDFAGTLDAMTALGDALNLSPCDALEMFFPAIVRDADVMGGLASLLDPAIPEVAHVIESGAITRDEGEHFLHNVFHLLQIAAALGHMLGVNEALAMSSDIPTSLDDVAWNDLPDWFGEGQEQS